MTFNSLIPITCMENDPCMSQKDLSIADEECQKIKDCSLNFQIGMDQRFTIKQCRR